MSLRNLKHHIASKYFAIGILLLTLVGGFQNCGEGFSVLESLSVSSSKVELLMNPEPTKGYVGDSAVLSVVAFTSNGLSPKYRWKKDDVLLPDQTESDLTIYNLKPIDSGKYKVEIESDDGNPITKESVVETQEILLEVVAAPVMPVSPTILTVRGSTSIASGARGLIAISVDGYPKPSIRWYKDGAPISGEVSPNLLFDKTAESLKTVEGIYHAEASNSAGIKKSESFAVIVDKSSVAPQLVRSSLLTQRIALGSRLNLEADVAAYPNARFQWLKDGIVIPGESASTLSRDNVTTSASGIYRLNSINAAGTITTEFNVTVVDTIQITTPLANQMVPQGQPTTLQTAFSGDVEKIEWYKEGVLIPNANTSALNLGNVLESASGVYRARAINISGAVETMATLTVVAPPTITTQLTADVAFDELIPINLTVNATGTGLTYLWFKNNVLLAGANMNRLSLGSASFLDAASYRVEITNLGGSRSSQSNVSVTLITDGAQLYARDCASCHGALPNSQRLNRTAAQIDNAIRTVPAMQSRFLKNGLVRLSPNQLESLEGALKVSPPVITSTAPPLQKVYETQATTFSVSATGAMLTYQWIKDGVVIAGATTANYTIPAAKMSDKGFYSVLVTNSGGTISSGLTLLDVMGVPAVTTNLMDRTVTESDTVSFTVSTDISNEFTWTWHRDSMLIKSGGMQEFDQIPLVISNITLADAGVYKLTVTNPAGSFVKTARLTVNQIPLVVVTPLPVKIVSHCLDPLNITASVTGGNSIRYEWLGGPNSSSTNTYSVFAGDCNSANLTLRVTSGTQVIDLKTELVRSYFKSVNGVTSFVPNANTVIAAPTINLQTLRQIFSDGGNLIYTDGDDCAFVINGYNPPKMAVTTCNGSNIRIVDYSYRYITDGTNVMYVYIDSSGARVAKLFNANIDHATVRKVGHSHLADSRAGYSANIFNGQPVTEFAGSDGATFVDLGATVSTCSKDKFRVYCDATPLPLESATAKLTGNHVSDRTKVYFLSNPPALLPNLVGANIVADGAHAWDLANVYFNRDQILGAMPATFRTIDSVNEGARTLFSKDSARAFFMEKTIVNADPATFVVKTYGSTEINGIHNYLAEDAVAKYACPYASTCTRTPK